MAMPSKMQRKDPPIQQSIFDPPVPLPPAPPRETQKPVVEPERIEVDITPRQLTALEDWLAWRR